jgi:LacI family transcriptional regulator
MPPAPLDFSPHIALLVETSLASGREILRGIARYLREQGNWSVFNSPRGRNDPAPEWLTRWKGHGIIARVTSPEMARILKKTRLPVVDVLGIIPKSGIPVVHVDDAAIAGTAFNHLFERGFRRFAFYGISGENWSENRRAAFLEKARTVHDDASVFEVSRSVFDEIPWEKRQDRLADWLRKLPKPAGLMVCSDQRGSDVLEACKRAGIQVPDEIAVVGVDNDEPLCEVCNPALSSIQPDCQTVGYEAAALLHRLIAGEVPPREPHLTPPGDVVTRLSSDVVAVEDPAVALAIKVIRERACAGISVDEIAQAAGASRSVLQRRFNSLIGHTIHDQIMRQRLKRAVELITTTSLSLPDIAEKSGFPHPEYMWTVFRNRLGKTPTQYRRPHAGLAHEPQPQWRHGGSAGMGRM